MRFAGIGKGVKGFTNTPVGSVARGFFGLATPVKTLKRVGGLAGGVGKAVVTGNQKDMALKSMQLLGTAAGVTYGVRALRGQHIFKNKRGKRDFVPFVPFV